MDKPKNADGEEEVDADLLSALGDDDAEVEEEEEVDGADIVEDETE